MSRPCFFQATAYSLETVSPFGSPNLRQPLPFYNIEKSQPKMYRREYRTPRPAFTMRNTDCLARSQTTNVFVVWLAREPHLVPRYFQSKVIFCGKVHPVRKGRRALLNPFRMGVRPVRPYLKTSSCWDRKRSESGFVTFAEKSLARVTIGVGSRHGIVERLVGRCRFVFFARNVTSNPEKNFAVNELIGSVRRGRASRKPRFETKKIVGA